VNKQLKPGISHQMPDIFLTTRNHAVQADNTVSLIQEPFAQMRSKKSRAAGYQYFFHGFLPDAF